MAASSRPFPNVGEMWPRPAFELVDWREAKVGFLEKLMEYERVHQATTTTPPQRGKPNPHGVHRWLDSRISRPGSATAGDLYLTLTLIGWLSDGR